MQFRCPRTELYDTISNVSRAVSGRSTLPVLEGILIRAKEGKLFFAGYDLDMGIFASIPADVQKEGEIVLSAKLFVDMIRRMDGEDVLLSSDEKLMTKIVCGSSEFTILGLSSEDYPEIPPVKEEMCLELPEYQLKSMIEQTLFAISTNDSKPVHTGSLFHLENEVLTVVSVDGFRLALRREKVTSKEEMRFIVPGKTLSEMTKLLSEEDQLVKMYLSKKHVMTKIGNYQIISRLLEGEFLDYKAAIPPGENTTVQVDVRPFIESIDRTSLLISDRLKSPLRVQFEEGLIKMSCSTAIGKANDQLPAQLQGEHLEIGFNNRYLLEALRASGCDQVKLLISGPLSPMKMVPVEGDHFLFLILPVRLKSEV